jgi:hypothetical protein
MKYTPSTRKTGLCLHAAAPMNVQWQTIERDECAPGHSARRG